MEKTICVVGLGYVGLPLALEFSRKYKTVGYDINSSRISELKQGFDRTGEVEKEYFLNSSITYTDNIADIESANIYIVTVPTPVDTINVPDMQALCQASRKIGSVLKKGDLVIYESTVYPGATEDICIPLLQDHSNLTFNVDFYVGYSPERINPGDLRNSLINISKITSGSTPVIANEIRELYQSIISAEVISASSIKVAEASKLIENVQRDVNIALINEFSLFFKSLNIDTHDVLNCAKTKWNFLPFTPGFVGGHCIGVDPYYLIHKAGELGFKPTISMAARNLNEQMPIIVAKDFSLALAKIKPLTECRCLIAGITFKAGCPDLRNSKVYDLKEELVRIGIDVDLYDPIAHDDDVRQKFGQSLICDPENESYDGIIIAVDHREFIGLENFWISKLKKEHLIFDLKSVYPNNFSDYRL